MLLIPCPFCGPRDQIEFTYIEEAARRRPAPGAAIPAFHDYVFRRLNPRGRNRELWQHQAGCRRMVVVERDTLTHAISGVWLAGAEPT
jgi:methylglutamate dehydrogenase subunit B